MSGEPLLVTLPPSSEVLFNAARSVLGTAQLPPVALIGGLAVTIRVSAAGVAHRATADIDLVTTYTEPGSETIDLLAAAHNSETHSIRIQDIQVDVIPTSPMSARDLDGFEDHDYLFLAGHRWAFETAELLHISITDSPIIAIHVATPAGLVAAKAHAVGYPSTTRRATKHGGDLLDLFRLIDLYNPQGELSQKIRFSTNELARIIADVIKDEILTNPVAATNMTTTASPTPLDPELVADVCETFIDKLRN